MFLLNMINIGYNIKDEFSFTQDDVNTFSVLTKDDNPIHLDEEYAKNTIFKRPIIHGFLGGSVFSKLLATKLWGNGTIYLKQNLKFYKPMYPLTKYTAYLEVMDLDYKKHRAKILTQVKIDNDLVIDGDALIQHKDI